MGKTDLTSSLGLTGMDDPKLSPPSSILLETQAAGKLTGISRATPPVRHYWISKGTNLVLLASDLMFMGNGATDARSQLEALLAG